MTSTSMSSGLRPHKITTTMNIDAFCAFHVASPSCYGVFDYFDHGVCQETIVQKFGVDPHCIRSWPEWLFKLLTLGHYVTMPSMSAYYVQLRTPHESMDMDKTVKLARIGNN